MESLNIAIWGKVNTLKINIICRLIYIMKRILVYLCVFVCACMHACTYVCVCVFVQVYMYVHMHMHIHKHKDYKNILYEHSFGIAENGKNVCSLPEFHAMY